MVKNRLLRSVSVVSLLTLLSRILGFIRDVLLATVFGAGPAFDAFVIAFKLPNFLRRLFAEGAFSQAFVPILAEYKELRTWDEAKQFISRMQGCLISILLMVVILGEILAPALVAIFAPGFMHDPARFALATHMLHITFPYILFISVVALMAAVFNTWRHFAVPAFTPVLLNLSLILAALLFATHVKQPIYVLAWGVFAAGIIQLLWQMPFLAKLGLLVRPSWWWHDAGVRRVLKLIVPALFGVSVAQVGLLIDNVFASFLPAGSISWLYYSDRFTFFPLGVIGVALTTVVLPQLSKQFSRKDWQHGRQTLDWALRIVLLLGVPAAAGLAILAGPILATLIHHGAFDSHDVMMTRTSLMAFAVGLPSFMLVKVLASAFYSMKEIKTPVKIAAIALVVNIVLNVALIQSLKHVGLALATSLASWVNSVLLWVMLGRRELFVAFSGWVVWVLRLLTATLIMSGAIIWYAGGLQQWLDWALADRIWHLFVAVLLGLVVYVVSLFIMGLRKSDLQARGL